MKRFLLISSFMIMGLSLNNTAKAQAEFVNPMLDYIATWYFSCVSGGEGAGGCSITVSVSGGGSFLGTGGNAGVQVTHSVSNCKDGYYACCNLLGANCVKEE